MTSTTTPSETYKLVQDRYGAYAQRDNTTGENLEHSSKVAQSFGYSPEDLAAIPEGANLGVSCGNPLAIAGLKEGETVIDLGSGAGFDVFLAARKVGPQGKAIGVDMNKEMLTLARTNLAKSALTIVTFVESLITTIPLDNGLADCIISNCVINLVPHPDKPAVFREMFRLLKPGGRVAVSDILARQELPPAIKNDIGLYVGCVSGASQVGEYERWLKEAGFAAVLIVEKSADLNIYKTGGLLDSAAEPSTCCDAGKTAVVCCRPENNEGCCSPSIQKDAKPCCGEGSEDPCCDPAEKVKQGVKSGKVDCDFDINEWAGSFNIYAIKPGKVV